MLTLITHFQETEPQSQKCSTSLKPSLLSDLLQRGKNLVRPYSLLTVTETWTFLCISFGPILNILTTKHYKPNKELHRKIQAGNKLVCPIFRRGAGGCQCQGDLDVQARHVRSKPSDLWRQQRLYAVPVCVHNQCCVRGVDVVGPPGDDKFRGVALDANPSSNCARSMVLGLIEDLHATIGAAPSTSVWWTLRQRYNLRCNT